MTCTSCGEHKHNKCSCGKCSCGNFTKSVIEIANPEKIVVLRKVVIPASMGDDVENPPVVGKYCNVVLYYEANGHVYIYSSDGIPTAIPGIPQGLLDRIADLEEGLEVETTERKEADKKLSKKIDDVNGDLAIEIAERAAADDHIRAEVETVRESIPTKVSDLQNDSNFQTDIQVDEKIADELAKFDHLDYKVVDTLPTVGEAGVRYLVKHPTDDRYEEYIYVDGQWYDIGSTEEVDLSGYYNKTETDALLNNKQDNLTAGSNITITNNVISATATGNTHSVELTQAEYNALTPEQQMDGTVYYITDGQGGGGKTYTGGTGITVDNVNDTISVDNTIAKKSDLIDNFAPYEDGWFLSQETGTDDIFFKVDDGSLYFREDYSGYEVTLYETETINDTDWSALWQ